MTSSTAAVPRRSPLERFLGLFADVRAGEGTGAVLMLATIFLILTAYYVLKTIREPLILTGGGLFGIGGAELKTYASASTAVILVVIIPAYGVLASRVRRIKLLNVTYAVVLGSLAAFFGLGNGGAPIGPAFFLWLGIVNHFLVGQFWSYANDVYAEEQGKRLFPVIAVGQSAGSLLGPYLAGLASIYAMMVIAAVLLALTIVMFNVVERGPRDSAGASPRTTDAPLGKAGGFQLVLAERYITLIALMMILANLVNTVGEYILSSGVQAHAAASVPDTAHAGIVDAAAQTAAVEHDRGDIVKNFYASFNFWMNFTALVIQSFLVSRVLKYAGVRVALFVLPFVALTGYGAIGLIGGFGLLRAAKTIENATDYSLQNTVRHALWLPTSREVKYKAKSAVDTFFVRIGDTLAAVVVWAGLHHLHLSPTGFAFANVCIISLWIVVCVFLARRHKAMSQDTAPA